MNPLTQELEALIKRKVAEGVFSSEQDAMETIQRWIAQLESDYAAETMRSEDA